MKFYVLRYDINDKAVKPFNIFNSVRFNEGIAKLDRALPFNEFVEAVRKEAMYAFWCKAEYEVMISDLFNSIEEKIDIYTQILPNIELVAKIILGN